MEKDLLEKIAKNTSLRPTFQIVLTGVGSRLQTTFTPALDLHVGCKYEIGLASLETYFSFPSMHQTTNLKYFLRGYGKTLSFLQDVMI